ncbi:GMC oxidoreductase [Viridothelium virens]|uniref:GMC oxidoreductase n=1 Tax=Viridothelium virens TaxID=1048519 RepID=A0A6A6GSH7_VIRVR|nr:GMC oxidoreductase [Viridothelium virens]
MMSQVKALCLAAVLAAGVHSRPMGNVPLGSSFGMPGTNATYDYVLVGGGTAGLTVASRLVEQGAGSVAVIEAGTFYELTNSNDSEVPSNAPAWAGNSATDWQPLADWGYMTTPQAGASNNSLHYPRGKMLGGCSGRNFLIYHRSTVGSFQRWADQVGDDSYTFENLLPWFEKSVNFTPPNNDLRLKNATPSYSTTSLGSSNGTLGALSQMGISLRTEGFLNGGLLGQAYAMFTQDRTTMFRSSSETAFLQKSLGDPNYYVYPLTQAKKVLFDETKTATGVLVDSGGFLYTLSARKEVIMAAGFIGSPQVLQASGVGPAQLLQSLNIPVVADLPGIGQGMQDHIVFGISQGINAITASNLGDPTFQNEQRQLFDKNATGLLTSVAADLVAWEKLPNSTRTGFSNDTLSYLATYPQDWPEVEYVAFSAYFGNGKTITGEDPQDGTPYGTMGVALHTPRSRASVNITSADTSVAPLLDPGWLTEQADVDVVVGGFKRARQFWAQSALSNFTVGLERYPGRAVATDEQIAESIRNSFQTEYHGSCTCAMGKPDDPNAVVDTKGRVYGVKRVRVVDTAAFPLLPPGHPQSIVYALAEKLACDISGNCP